MHTILYGRYRPLLLLSVSGFRADYLMRNYTPNLKKLSECGVNAPYMRAVYPTKTYPNHYTIVTVRIFALYFIYPCKSLVVAVTIYLFGLSGILMFIGLRTSDRDNGNFPIPKNEQWLHLKNQDIYQKMTREICIFKTLSVLKIHKGLNLKKKFFFAIKV